jgi:hypothetical protein
MALANRTQRTARVRATRREETLETSYSSDAFLSAVWQKLCRVVTVGKHHKAPSNGYMAPLPASSCVMLVESDVRGGVSGVLP